ncbi:MAG: arylsulfatase, partial [Bryobacteraceae bacterium]
TVGGAAAQAPPPSRPPNVILILADDLGFGDLGCYGQRQIQTPVLDRMAQEGMRFTQAYSGSTVCAPSRCTLMTGMHNGHGRVRDNIPHGVFLQPDDVTVAEVLKTAGYQCGVFGKWSLGNPGSWGKPRQQGFDEWFGYLNQDQAHIYYPEEIWENDREELLMGNRAGARKQYMPDLCTDRAVEFVEKNRHNPFFLYLPYTLPHWSDFPPNSVMSQDVPSDAPYSKEAWPEVERKYAAMVTRLDGYVGRLLDTVKKQGLDSNTLVIFTSDNGPSAEALHRPAFFKSGGPYRGVKRELYEGGIRVPMIARWPGRVAAGKTSDHACAFWDVLPTLGELAGLPPPKGIDGLSFAPELMGRSQAKHDFLYWDYGLTRDKFCQALHWKDWKLVRNGIHSTPELYDLAKDPGESRDVASANPGVVRDMLQMIASAYRPSPDYPVKELAGK